MNDKYFKMLFIISKSEDVQKLRPNEIDYLKEMVKEIETIIQEKG